MNRCVKIIGDIKRYTTRAEELGYTSFSLNDNANFIKLYDQPTKRYNALSCIQLFVNEMSQKDFFGESGMSPEQALGLINQFDSFNCIFQNGDNVYVSVKIPVKQQYDESYSKYFLGRVDEKDLRHIDVKIDWPDPKNKIYPPLPKNISVELNSTHTAVVSKDTIVVGCQTFPISILDKLIEARDAIKR